MNSQKQTIVIPIREPNAFREPTLKEMFSDPIVKAVMKADDVDPSELCAMLCEVSAELRKGSERRGGKAA
jgi:hypothetical protein